MHDPFAMRPFFGYNFGDYLQHWLSFQQRQEKLPKIFHVNWFRKDDKGHFLWPGFGENARVLEWIFRRVDGENIANESAIGYIPKLNSLNLSGLEQPVDLQELFRLPADFWQDEVKSIYKYFDEQVNDDLPPAIMEELKALEKRVSQL